MTVYQTDIPGVGRKFELELTGGARVVVVMHHDGRCELYRRDSDEADGRKILDLTADQANKLGSILEGAYFETVDVDSLTVPLGDAVIDWIEVADGSPIVGQSLGEAAVRQETGVSVIAVQRDGQTESNPPSEFVVRPGDVLVAIGTREEQTELADLVASD